MDPFIIGIVVFFGFVMLSRFILDKANKQLDEDKKAILIDDFSKQRMINFVMLIAVIVFYFVVTSFNLIDPTLAFIIYITVFGLIFIGNEVVNYRKFKARNFPDFYIRAYITSSAIRAIGIVSFISFLLLMGNK